MRIYYEAEKFDLRKPQKDDTKVGPSNKKVSVEKSQGIDIR